MVIMILLSHANRNRILFVVFALMLSTVGGHTQENAFVDFVKERLKRESGTTQYSEKDFDQFCSIKTNPLHARVLFEYGAVFSASREVRLPLTCIFETAAQTNQFQSKLKTRTLLFGTVEIELQEEAMKHLSLAVEEASRSGLSITPLDGSIAGRRSYYETLRIWGSRFYRALDRWTERGRIGAADADQVRMAPFREQAERVMRWESEGVYFSTDLSKSIFHSVAPPGASQHLHLLAFDVVEGGNPEIRRILNKYGWYQTIRTDQPHFTFLGVPEAELPQRGLQNVSVRGNSYWVPAFGPAPPLATPLQP